MGKALKYMPILRGRQEEIKVLKSFDFKDEIFPCLEIIKEVDRQMPKPKNGRKQKRNKSFEEVYIPLISTVKAKHVFVDLPIHLKVSTGMKLETVEFLQSVVLKREKRTEYLKKFKILNSKVIPIISTYSGVTP